MRQRDIFMCFIYLYFISKLFFTVSPWEESRMVLDFEEIGGVALTVAKLTNGDCP